MKLRILLLPFSVVFELVGLVCVLGLHLVAINAAIRVTDFFLSMPDTEWYLEGWRK